MQIPIRSYAPRIRYENPAPSFQWKFYENRLGQHSTYNLAYVSLISLEPDYSPTAFSNPDLKHDRKCNGYVLTLP